MATIMLLILFVVLIGVSAYWLPKAPFFSETLQQLTGSIDGLEVRYCVVASSYAVLIPSNDDESLKEKEIANKSFEKATQAMIDSRFSGVLGEH